MRITTKGRYALRAVIALAETSIGGSPVSIKSIAEKEAISAEFLEQIFFRLKKGGLIGSARGPGGGFYFQRPFSEISLLDIIEASGEGLAISPCSCGEADGCVRSENCRARRIWEDMDLQLRDYAGNLTLEDVLSPASP